MSARANIARLRRELKEAKEAKELKESKVIPVVSEDNGPTQPETYGGPGEPLPKATEALRNLFAPPANSTDEKRTLWLEILGSGKYPLHDRHSKRTITRQHEKLFGEFHGDEEAEKLNDEDVLNKLLPMAEGVDVDFGNLLAHGEDGFTILDILLDPATYGKGDSKELHFSRLKPLIRFLLRLHPELPAVDSPEGSGPPLYRALNYEGMHVFNPKEKQDIVSFLCERKEGCLGSSAAIRSLAQVSSSRGKVPKVRHALHLAIESSDFEVSENVVKELGNIMIEVQGKKTKSGLGICDEQGRTCLHIALTRSLSPQKVWWAETIARLMPDLLKARVDRPDSKTERLTPLQHYADQIGRKSKEVKTAEKAPDKTSSPATVDTLVAKVAKMEAELKRLCLANFDHSTCMRVMYKKGSMRQIFLTLDDETVSFEFLESQQRHYTLDTSLKRVHISNSVSVHWDDSPWSVATRKTATKWKCAGSIDFFMIFHWLKDKIQVKKVLEVVVDDRFGNETRVDDPTVRRKRPHSDRAIVESLASLDVETFDWQRADIPADVIIAAAPNVKTLYLYCSGLQAVLQSWAAKEGLPALKKLRSVIVEIEQGLESIEWITTYALKFKKDLEETFEKERAPDPHGDLDDNGEQRKLSVKCCIVSARRRLFGRESATSKMKNENEQGFEEQDWLKCMDEFADIMEKVEQPINTKLGIIPPKRHIRVALIDDGVKSSYAGLDDRVVKGESGWSLAESEATGTQPDATRREYLRSYNSSVTGHGTVMAYYITRVCPKVHLYVAKLDPELHRVDVGRRGERVTFSRDSAAKAIEWAVEEDVDIISMSWAIDEDVTSQSRLGAEDPNKRLRDALQLAVNKRILLFCANPDKGPGYQKNNTSPRSLNPDNIFCIGAATQNGVRWGKIDPRDASCDYFLPGVELGIQVESASGRNLDEPPMEWRKHSGSSLSCALAAGLAALILHCAAVTGQARIDEEVWKSLRTPEGMRKAFENIQVERSGSGWLPVRRLFGKAVNMESKTEDKVKGVQKLVRDLLSGLPVAAAVDMVPDPKPGALERRRTAIKDDNLFVHAIV